MHIGYWRESQKERDHYEDNIKMDLREIEWDGMDWIDPAQVRDQWRALVNTVMNLRVLYDAWKFFSSCTTGAFSEGLSSMNYFS
jgi:hypothetical protein